jgi:hypothetical protein
VLLTDTGLPSPPLLSVQEWVFDTGHTGDGFCWRYHLEVAGIDPDVQRAASMMRLRVSGGQPIWVPVREMDLWLVSNIPSLQGNPFRLSLNRGIPFIDLPNRPDPQYDRPLIGMRALRRAGLRVELDFANDTVSVWTP